MDKNIVKAVIFDMDGLLIDSEPFWQEAEMDAFSEVGIPLTREMCKETMGKRVDEVVEYWFSRYPWPAPGKKEIEGIIVEKVISLVKNKGAAKEGVSEVMEFFSNKKLPMAIASSSQSKIIEAVLDKISLGKYIRLAHSAEGELYGKPHPGVYLTAASKLNIDPKFCLAFEDSPNGVIAAKAAEMQCVAVPDKSMKENEAFLRADMVIDSLKEFPQKFLE